VFILCEDKFYFNRLRAHITYKKRELATAMATDMMDCRTIGPPMDARTLDAAHRTYRSEIPANTDTMIKNARK
jgi:hypothetical protein